MNDKDAIRGMVLAFGLALVVCFVCCHDIPDYYTSDGLGVYMQDVPEATYEVVDPEIRCFAERFPELDHGVSLECNLDALSNGYLKWSRELIECRWTESGKCWGLFYGTVAWVFWREEIRQTALMHELVHMSTSWCRYLYDPTHSDTIWWIINDGRLCGANYVLWVTMILAENEKVLL